MNSVYNIFIFNKLNDHGVSKRHSDRKKSLMAHWLQTYMYIIGVHVGYFKHGRKKRFLRLFYYFYLKNAFFNVFLFFGTFFVF